MPNATIISKNITEKDSYVIVDYEEITGVASGSVSSELITLELPGLNLDSSARKNYPNQDLTGESYVIELISLQVASSSEDFDARFLNIDDISKINSINEIYSYEEINFNFIDQDFERYVVINKDDPMDNKIYLYIKNDGSVATGTIYVSIIYKIIQQRAFIETE